MRQACGIGDGDGSTIKSSESSSQTHMNEPLALNGERTGPREEGVPPNWAVLLEVRENKSIESFPVL